jgi:hypothetical protein
MKLTAIDRALKAPEIAGTTAVDVTAGHRTPALYL